MAARECRHERQQRADGEEYDSGDHRHVIAGHRADARQAEEVLGNWTFVRDLLPKKPNGEAIGKRANHAGATTHHAHQSGAHVLALSDAWFFSAPAKETAGP